MIDPPERALVVFAHPDDEIGCAGTVAYWTAHGTEVNYVVCTNGNKGTENPEISAESVAQTREQEQRDAAAVVGVKEVVFPDYPDGELEDTREFRGQVVREIRRFRPQVVLTHSPINRLRHNHRDHRNCGTVTLDAVFPYARDPGHFAELTKDGFEPHKVGTVLMWGSDEPDEFMDISDVLETKVRSMLCHSSQCLERPSRDRTREPGQFMMEGAKRMGEHVGIPYAEGFRKLEFRT